MRRAIIGLTFLSLSFGFGCNNSSGDDISKIKDETGIDFRVPRLIEVSSGENGETRLKQGANYIFVRVGEDFDDAFEQGLDLMKKRGSAFRPGGPPKKEVHNGLESKIQTGIIEGNPNLEWFVVVYKEKKILRFAGTGPKVNESSDVQELLDSVKKHP